MKWYGKLALVVGIVIIFVIPFGLLVSTAWKYERALARINRIRAEKRDTHYSLEFTCGNCGFTTINEFWETKHELWVENGTLKKDAKCPNCKLLLGE